MALPPFRKGKRLETREEIMALLDREHKTWAKHYEQAKKDNLQSRGTMKARVQLLSGLISTIEGTYYEL